MKTSTKLLIILFISIPITMLAFNWLLVNEYHAGNLILRRSPQKKMENRELPAFKHVVMDGRINHGNDPWATNGISLDLDSRLDHKPQLLIPNDISKNIVTNVINDTLYISYYKKKVDEDALPFWNRGRMSLYAPKINSVTFSYGNYLIMHIDTDSLRLQANNATISVNNVTTPTLSATALKLSTIHFYDNNKIGQFEYSIPDKDGKIEIGENTSQSYKPGKVHPEAKLVLSGKASEIQKHIMQ